MSTSLFSPEWYRVADLHPRLRPQVQTQQRQWRGQGWFVLSDAGTGRQHLINQAAYQFIGRCDGRHSVQRVWDSVLEMLGDAAPTQDEIIQLLAQLNEHELLQCEHTPDSAALFARRAERRKIRRRQAVNPFSFRLSLGDPTAWLARLDGVGKLLFRPLMLWLWIAMLVFGLLAVAGEWDELSDYWRVHALSPLTLGLAWLLFPVIKALHELGHAMAVRRWGGEVHDVGIGLLVLVPAPYVDASASAGFARRAQRATVAAAGIMVETTLSGLGLLVWLNVQPGLVRDIAFVTMMIGGVSTLLFNGNPLLRFDGYYLFTDVLDLPNLAARSSAFWGRLVRRHLLRARTEAPPLADGELKWLLLYAPLSYAYRLTLAVAIILLLGGKWFLLGVLAAAYFIVSMLFRPVATWIRQALATASPGREAARVRLGIALLMTIPGALFFALPLPFATVSPGVVWLPEQAHIRPEIDGFVATIAVRDGALVKPGDLLVVLDNPELYVESSRLASRLSGLQADHYLRLLRDPGGAQNIAEQITRTEAEIELINQRIAHLEVRAQVAGTVVMPRQVDLPGSSSARERTSVTCSTLRPCAFAPPSPMKTLILCAATPWAPKCAAPMAWGRYSRRA